MIGVDEAAKQVKAVWNLAFGSADWREEMNRSVDDVFNSFWAMAFSIPFALIGFAAGRGAVLASPQAEGTALLQSTSLPLLLTAETISLLAYWVAGLVALGLIARSTDTKKHFGDTVIAYNWAQLISFLLFSIPAAALAVTQSTEVFALLALPMLIINVFILWRVIRETLQLNVGATIGMIIMLMLIEVVVSSILTPGVIGFVQLFS